MVAELVCREHRAKALTSAITAPARPGLRCNTGSTPRQFDSHRAVFGSVQSRRDTHGSLRHSAKIKLLKLRGNRGSFTKSWTPSVGGDGGGYAGDLGQKGTKIFFQRGLDDPNH